MAIELLAALKTIGTTIASAGGKIAAGALKEYKNKLGNNKGDSCTALMLLNLNKEFPEAPVVVIETDTKRAIEFSKEIYGKDLTQEMNVLNEQMKFIKGLRIRLENLDNSLEEIWTYLIGTSYNKERGDLLKNMNIQTNNFNYDIKAAGELLCR